MMRRFSPLNITALTLGLAFLYLPIAILVINSFNGSRLVTTWGGWSLRWYRVLADDSAMWGHRARQFRRAVEEARPTPPRPAATSG